MKKSLQASESKSLRDRVVHKSDSKRRGYPEDTCEERLGAPSYPRSIWSDIIGATRWKGDTSTDRRRGKREKESMNARGEEERNRGWRRERFYENRFLGWMFVVTASSAVVSTWALFAPPRRENAIRSREPPQSGRECYRHSLPDSGLVRPSPLNYRCSPSLPGGVRSYSTTAAATRSLPPVPRLLPVPEREQVPK